LDPQPGQNRKLARSALAGCYRCWPSFFHRANGTSPGPAGWHVCLLAVGLCPHWFPRVFWVPPRDSRFRAQQGLPGFHRPGRLCKAIVSNKKPVTVAPVAFLPSFGPPDWIIACMDGAITTRNMVGKLARQRKPPGASLRAPGWPAVALKTSPPPASRPWPVFFSLDPRDGNDCRRKWAYFEIHAPARFSVCFSLFVPGGPGPFKRASKPGGRGFLALVYRPSTNQFLGPFGPAGLTFPGNRLVTHPLKTNLMGPEQLRPKGFGAPSSDRGSYYCPAPHTFPARKSVCELARKGPQKNPGPMAGTRRQASASQRGLRICQRLPMVVWVDRYGWGDRGRLAGEKRPGRCRPASIPRSRQPAFMGWKVETLPWATRRKVGPGGKAPEFFGPPERNPLPAKGPAKIGIPEGPL